MLEDHANYVLSVLEDDEEEMFDTESTESMQDDSENENDVYLSRSSCFEEEQRMAKEEHEGLKNHVRELRIMSN